MNTIDSSWPSQNGLPEWNKLKFDDVIHAWYEFHKREIVKSTAYNYEKGLSLVQNYFTDISIQDITPEMIYEFIYFLGASELYESSRRLYCNILKLSLRYAQRMRWIYYNPCDDVKFPKNIRATIHPFTVNEVALLLQQKAPEWVKRAIVITFYTGLRPCELFCLDRYLDINLDVGYIMVQNSITRASSKTGLRPKKETKTPTGVRRVDIGQILIRYLRDLDYKAENPYIFPSGNNKCEYRVPWNISKIVKRMCRDAGIPERDFRSMRHTHATILLEKGVHPKIVQERLGHSDIKITMDTYSHVAPTLQRQAVAVLDEIPFELI